MKKTPAKADLNAYDFESSITDLLDLDQKLGIIPEHSRDTMLETLDELKRRADEIGWVTNRQIVDNASALVGAVAHLSRTQVNQYLAREDADVAHRARNRCWRACWSAHAATSPRRSPSRCAQRCRPSSLEVPA